MKPLSRYSSLSAISAGLTVGDLAETIREYSDALACVSESIACHDIGKEFQFSDEQLAALRAVQENLTAFVGGNSTTTGDQQ